VILGEESETSIVERGPRQSLRGAVVDRPPRPLHLHTIDGPAFIGVIVQEKSIIEWQTAQSAGGDIGLTLKRKGQRWQHR
jgi:hypothetical protein